MPHTLVAFFESITNASVYTDVSAVADQTQTVDAGSRLQVRTPAKLAASYVMGINLTAARIDAPSFRGLLTPEIYPCNPTADVRAIDKPAIYGRYGLEFVQGEGVSVQVSRGGADAQPVIAGLWLGGGASPLPSGRVSTLVATAAPTLTVGTWVFAQLTLGQTLPAGRYAIVGMAVVCNDCTFARLVFPGEAYNRPGVLVQDVYGDQPTDDDFRMGGMGVFGEFEWNSPPSLEFLGDTAGAESAVVYLDIIKIR